MTLHPIPTQSAGTALRILREARALGLSASYHPHGGMTEKRDTPVSHTVWVMGTQYAVRKFTEANR